jgi:small subunit ribosomal protein S20
MARTLSSRKRIRQNARQHQRNRARKSQLRTAIRGFEAKLSEPGAKPVEDFRLFCKAIDRAAARGTLHKNTAARRKSRMARRLNAAKAR